MSKKIPVRTYADAEVWKRSEQIWEQFGVSNSVGVEQLLKLLVTDELVDISKTTGVPNIEILNRLVNWFADLEQKLQLGIISGDLKTRNELFHLHLEGVATADNLSPIGKIGREDSDRRKRAASKTPKVPDHMK